MQNLLGLGASLQMVGKYLSRADEAILWLPDDQPTILVPTGTGLL